VARTSRALPVVGYLFALAGLALLVIEAARTINGSALGSLGVVLLWVGVGLIGVAIALLTYTLLRAETGSGPGASAGGGQPADG
jgi:hypothetical protein